MALEATSNALALARILEGRVARVVLAPLESLGLGAARDLPIAGNGGFLTLLPGDTRARFRLRATFADGTVLQETPRGGDLIPGSGRVDARTPDPDALRRGRSSSDEDSAASRAAGSPSATDGSSSAAWLSSLPKTEASASATPAPLAAPGA